MISSLLLDTLLDTDREMSSAEAMLIALIKVELLHNPYSWRDTLRPTDTEEERFFGDVQKSSHVHRAIA